MLLQIFESSKIWKHDRNGPFSPFSRCSPYSDLLDLSDGLLLVVRLGQILQLITEVQGLRQPLENHKECRDKI